MSSNFRAANSVTGDVTSPEARAAVDAEPVKDTTSWQPR